MRAPDLERIREVHARLGPHVRRTPVALLGGAVIQEAVGGEVWLKLELLQRTGTFKIRGALNNMLAAELEAGAGVTAVSAGNHAVAVACAAQQLGLDAKVVLLGSANPARRELARAYGATLLVRDDGAEAFALAEELVESEGRMMVHPFEGPRVAEATAGVALELLEDVPDLEAVVVAIGGGGLAGGVGAAVRQLAPGCAVYGVEPEGADSMRQSLDAGRPLRGLKVRTISDSLGPPYTLDYSVELCGRFLDDVVTVSDDDTCRALALLFHEAKLAVEPAAAVALAGALGPLRDRLAGRRTALIVCGSCIDVPTYTKLLRRGEELDR